MKNTRIGLIGCGKQATKHISSLQTVPGIEIILSDIDADISRNLAEKESLAWKKQPDEIIDDNSIKAVVICTPTTSHASLIKEAINKKKDVFCEKPLSDSLDEVMKMRQIVNKSESIVTIGYIYRFVPIFEEGYKLFLKGQVNGESLVMGKTLSAFFRLGGRGSHQLWKHRKESGGGAINEMLVHMIDLANWYFGPLRDIKVISCDLRYPERVIQGKKARVDTEDFIVVRAFGANGTEIFCQADLITPAFCQYVEIQAENGSFMGSIQSDSPSYIFLKENRGGYQAGKTEFGFGKRNIFDIQMLAFIQAVIKKQPLDRNTIDDSLQLIEIMEQIRKQVKI